jgi:hypothetical protein
MVRSVAPNSKRDLFVHLVTDDFVSFVPSSNTIGSSKRFDQPCVARAKAGLLS